MLELKLLRTKYNHNTTIGEMTVCKNGKKLTQFYTLEDTTRPMGIKVKHHTSIPEGSYEVVVNYSPKFKRQLPYVKCVPNFTGIRIHSGNSHVDSSGCILLGLATNEFRVSQSRVAVESFIQILNDDNDKCVLTVVNLNQK